jgi:tetratricopeptide (TPR) repeat protein
MAKLGKSLHKSAKVSTEEKLLEKYYKSTEYYQNNKNRVYTILTVVIVLIVVAFIYFRNQNSNSEAAALELSKVKQFYSMDLYQQCIAGDSLGISKGLLFIVNNYGSSESGQTAKIMLANCYFNLRDFDNAEKYYKDYSGSNELFKTSSLAGVASVYEAKNDFANAAKYFEKASKMSKLVPNNDEYLFYAIRNYYYAKDTDNLKKAIKSLKEEYPKSKYLGQINRFDMGEA